MALTLTLPSSSAPEGSTHIEVYKLSETTGNLEVLEEVDLAEQPVPEGEEDPPTTWTQSYEDADGTIGDVYAMSFYDEDADVEYPIYRVYATSSDPDVITLFGTLTDVDGIGVESSPVAIRLEHEGFATLYCGSRQLEHKRKTTETDVNGVWFFNVIPNSSIYPEGSWYVVELYNGNCNKYVASSGGLYQNVVDCLEVLPLIRR